MFIGAFNRLPYKVTTFMASRLKAMMTSSERRYYKFR